MAELINRRDKFNGKTKPVIETIVPQSTISPRQSPIEKLHNATVEQTNLEPLETPTIQVVPVPNHFDRETKRGFQIKVLDLDEKYKDPGMAIGGKVPASLYDEFKRSCASLDLPVGKGLSIAIEEFIKALRKQV